MWAVKELRVLLMMVYELAVFCNYLRIISASCMTISAKSGRISLQDANAFSSALGDMHASGSVARFAAYGFLFPCSDYAWLVILAAGKGIACGMAVAAVIF